MPLNNTNLLAGVSHRVREIGSPSDESRSVLSQTDSSKGKDLEGCVDDAQLFFPPSLFPSPILVLMVSNGFVLILFYSVAILRECQNNYVL